MFQQQIIFPQILILVPKFSIKIHLIYPNLNPVIISFSKTPPTIFLAPSLVNSQKKKRTSSFFFSKRIQFGGSKSAFLLQRGGIATLLSRAEQSALSSSSQQSTHTHCCALSAKRSFFQDLSKRDNSVIRIMSK